MTISAKDLFERKYRAFATKGVIRIICGGFNEMNREFDDLIKTLAHLAVHQEVGLALYFPQMQIPPTLAASIATLSWCLSSEELLSC